MAILRKIKEKLSRSKRPSRITARNIFRGITKKTKKKEVSKEIKKEILGAQETTVGQTKFSTPEPSSAPQRIRLEELPAGYRHDKIVLQVRDSRWIHAYWEIIPDTLDGLRNSLGSSYHSAKKILRVYDVTDIIFNGNNAHRSFDIEVTESANNWYIDTAGPGKSWCVDIGLRLASGEFIMIARSNTVFTPLEGPSWITDEEWMIPEDMFASLYGMGFGFGRSSPVGKGWQERIKRELFSGILASPGLASMASPVKVAKERKFWLVVDCELIVYGATDPAAKVTVQDKKINLRPDGTFTLRYALPDGKQFIPVKAVSPDNIEERAITPIVTRETKST